MATEPATIITKTYKTMMSTSDDPATDGDILKMDTIEYEGQFWLVPEWLDRQSRPVSMPARIILLDILPHERAGEGFLLMSPIPKSVLDGQVPPELKTEYVVLERPQIRIRTPDRSH